LAVKETNPISILDSFYAYLDTSFSAQTSVPYFGDMLIVEGISEVTSNNRVSFAWTKWEA